MTKALLYLNTAKTQRINASLLTKRGEYMLLHEIQLNDLVQKEFQ